MGKETAIKVSKEFKEFLFANKKEGEDFESTIKRLVNYENLNSEPVNHEEDKQLTSEPEEYKKTIKTRKTETIEKDLPKLPGQEISYDELPSEIGGVKIKNNG